jgi:hypothetical protein
MMFCLDLPFFVSFVSGWYRYKVVEIAIDSAYKDFKPSIP